MESSAVVMQQNIDSDVSMNNQDHGASINLIWGSSGDTFSVPITHEMQTDENVSLLDWIKFNSLKAKFPQVFAGIDSVNMENQFGYLNKDIKLIASWLKITIQVENRSSSLLECHCVEDLDLDSEPDEAGLSDFLIVTDKILRERIAVKNDPIRTSMRITSVIPNDCYAQAVVLGSVLACKVLHEAFEVPVVEDSQSDQFVVGGYMCAACKLMTSRTWQKHRYSDRQKQSPSKDVLADSESDQSDSDSLTSEKFDIPISNLGKVLEILSVAGADPDYLISKTDVQLWSDNLSTSFGKSESV